MTRRDDRRRERRNRAAERYGGLIDLGVAPPRSMAAPPPPPPPPINHRRSLNDYRQPVLSDGAEITPLDKLIVRPGDTLIVRTANADDSECDKIHRIVRIAAARIGRCRRRPRRRASRDPA